MISEALIAILCCPETHQSLAMADPALLAKLNEEIQAGVLKNRGGEPVTTPLDAGLVRQDKKILYAIRNNIPVMLPNEGIPLPENLPGSDNEAPRLAPDSSVS